MYNLLIALAVGVALTLGVKLAGFSIWAGLVPGTIAFLGSYLFLARRIALKVQGLMSACQAELKGQPTSQRDMQQRLERAVRILESGLVYERWQFLVGPEIHAQIGMLQYMGKDLNGAKAHLSRANSRNYMAKAMEGALHFQRKDFPAMVGAFEAATKSGKKESIVWATYAWCLLQNKEKEKALGVLGRGVEANPTDEKLKASLTSLQNDKKLKMKPYEPMWWQFGLEAPPLQAMGGRRVQFTRR